MVITIKYTNNYNLEKEGIPPRPRAFLVKRILLESKNNQEIT